ncbi:synaptotagmin-4, putative [Pediculus humanus corporis]|uniref:Synaptotagmin-4, putative n=1 Tax=Pediculus humanus subsp. corporis TaxID=121224 RepID=E0VRM9_PEDHC|nr:synaptotagmin-4, putative [Pediculus humanus corporis]EEB16035.1 synaptotagmin-4, putative [Pediculus humanus corporis]
MGEGLISTPALVGICLAALAFFVGIFAVTCFCHRSRYTNYGSNKLFGSKKFKAGAEKPLAFHQHRKPTAVKSPAGTGGNIHYLKKSPSPTGGKSPSGGSAASSPTNPDQRSPITDLSPTAAACAGGENGQKNTLTVTNSAPVCVVENEKQKSNSVQSKDETESNEKNTTSTGKLGLIVFKLRYKTEKNALIVSVVKCKDLPAKDSNTDSSDPYVKLQLLPDKQHKVKTRVLRKTRNPVYDEDFTFYGISPSQLQATTLHFVVLSFDRYSRDDIIGEVFCSLSNIDVTQFENQQLALCREIQPRSIKIRSQGRGEILISLCWQPAANRLTVVILKARNLPKMDVTGLADPYVKMYLLCNNQRIAKKKTHVKKRTLNPVFNESFIFEIPAGAEKLDNISLEFLLLDWDRVTKNEVIGRLELGGEKATGTALHHWNEVCNSPRRQIAEWHKLKE